MCTASPKMNSLPILALLLLLLAHCTPLARGHPLPTTYITLIEEVGDLLSQPVLPKGNLGINEKITLQNKNLLRTNLEQFLNATENFKNKTEKIRKILPEFRMVVPTALSMDHSIHIDENDWDDFRRKLKEYLDSLRRFISAKIFSPTTRSSSGPS